MKGGTFNHRSNEDAQDDGHHGGRPNKGKTILAIYELTGDTLKVCYDVSVAVRPVKFESTDENKLVLIVYKKKK